ncbi:hypothetical protein [Shinella zoogloeoides]|uniref:DUF998 domain-containing protein n=1 Tax=Shinella zoogloeoides TaxID=352475 RepID=A0A6N8TLN4_SHIZO|nr:hypothetical protein [Shinella zoogloeoides]MXO02044.1 hypothetical protein [Shinella zoogloeoides]UEX81674.1 hypothetical protein K8M09_19295 [Shinella zoogloeoides]
MSRLLLILIGMVFLLVAALCDLEYSSLGFPDGHLTEFDIETRSLRYATAWANLALGLLACALGAVWHKAPIALVPVFAVALILVAAPSRILPRCPQIQSCISIYEGITGHPPDDGIGG